MQEYIDNTEHSALLALCSLCISHKNSVISAIYVLNLYTIRIEETLEV